MLKFIRLCFGFPASAFKFRVALKAGDLALRRQLCLPKAQTH